MENKVYSLALFGKPVSHSLSPLIHQQFAEQFDIEIDYQLIEVEAEDFLQEITVFFHAGGYGANVTLPHKQEARKSLQCVSKMAKVCHTVNTIFLNADLEICGDNTDGIGFTNDLKNRCNFNCKEKKILLLGAGGAAQGIVPAIMQQKPKQLIIANRTLTKAQKIAKYTNSSAIDFDQLKQWQDSFDLIVHSSSLGHQGKTLKFEKQHIHENTLCYDLSYAKAALPFLKFSAEYGIKNRYDGIGMLIEQAALSFEIWFDFKPDIKTIKV